MVQKLINISENIDINLKSIANNLGLSEDELIVNILNNFLEKDATLKDSLDNFLIEAEVVSQTHNLPKEYKFNRLELYE